MQKKRARTLPPRSLNRELNAKKNARKAAKQTKLEQEKAARRQERERNFLREVLSEVPQAQATSNGEYPPLDHGIAIFESFQDLTTFPAFQKKKWRTPPQDHPRQLQAT
jgi:hypothetical protein